MFSITLRDGVILDELILHMGNNGLEGYYAKKCLFFLKFAQELLKNGEG